MIALFAFVKRHRLSALVLAAGLALASTLGLVAQDAQWRGVELAFHAAAQNRISAVEQRIASAEADVVHLGRFIENANGLSRPQFSAFAGELLRSGAGLQALEWIPRVRDADRAAVTATAREAFPGFTITERDASGRLVPEPRRDEYFPVYYVEPYRGNERALGFDLASEPVRGAALRKAIETQKPTATAGITLVQEKGNEVSVLLFVPVRVAGTLRGFALAVIRTGDIVEAALGGTPPAGLDLQLRDVSAPPGHQLLYVHYSRSRPARTQAPPELARRPRLMREASFEFGGRRWTLVATPVAGAFPGRDAWSVLALPLAVVVLTGVLVVFVETSQKQAAMLGASEARFRNLFESSPDGVFIQSGETVELANNACAALFGAASSAALVGKPILGLLGPESRVRAQRAMADFAQRRVPFVQFEDRISRPDGSAVDVEVKATQVTYGGMRAFQVVLRDVTEHKRAELLLADSESRLRALIENASDIITVIDPQGVITYVSAAARNILGYEPREVVGTQMESYLHPADVPTARADIAEILRAPGNTHAAELRYRHKDGSWVILRTLGKNALQDPLIGGIIVTAHDETAQRRSEQVIHKVNRALKVLSYCNAVLVHATDETQLLAETCRAITATGGYLLAWIGYADQDPAKTVRAVAHAGYQPGFMDRAQASWADAELGRGPVGNAIRTGTLQLVRDVRADPVWAPWRGNAERIGYRSVVVLPLVSGATTLGALSIYSAEPDAFDGDEIALLKELADDLTFGVFALRAKAAEQGSLARLARSMESTIEAIAATVEMRDAYTAGHQRRVAELAVAIAQEMRLPEDEVHGIHLAAAIHDVGKISIPADILAKPARLTDIETQLVRTHAQTGYEILKGIEFPWPIAQLVYQHHERFDGSGYPRGLKGSDILLGARIIAVADTVEAMSSHRPYRPAVGIDPALAEVTRFAGARYDAAVVEACVRLFREKHFAFTK